MSLYSETDRPDPQQIAAWRRMGGVRRTELATRLREQTAAVKRDSLMGKNPDWNEVEVAEALARYFLRGHA